ncbi:CDGSH iron-sulfur domain-containing protein 3, mitochondrial-like [Ornithodoros turicata]
MTLCAREASRCLFGKYTLLITPLSCARSYSSSHTKPRIPELEERPEKQHHRSYTQPGTGRIYDKKPFKFQLKQGRVYNWCSCGFSHMQPFCDGSHANPHLKITMRPLRIVATETREYWFCNCKQSSHRPFCDGTHKSEAVQSAVSVIKN